MKMSRRMLKKCNESNVVDNLLPGDVIVSLGTSWVARLIARLTKDGAGAWNHVGIVTMHPLNGLCVAEALSKGVRYTTLDWHWRHCKKWMVVRSRLVVKMHNDMHNTSIIDDIISNYIGTPYAFKQLWLDVLMLSMVYGVGKKEAYNQLVSFGDPKGMTCTEFVGHVMRDLGVEVKRADRDGVSAEPRFLTANDYITSMQFDTLYTSWDD